MPELAKIAWTSDECALGPDPGGAASDALLSQAVSVTRSSLSDAHNRRGNLHANSYQNPAMQLQPVCLLCGASSGENNEAVLPFLPFRLRGDEISLGGSAVDALAPTVEVLQRGLRLCDQASNGILAPRVAICGVVAARAVKDSRESWWADLQEELLSHARALGGDSIARALICSRRAHSKGNAKLLTLLNFRGGDAFGDGNGTTAPAHCHDSSFFGAAPVAGPDLGHSRPLTASTVSHPMRPTPEVLERLNEAVACHLQRRKGDSSAPAVADSFDWPLDPLL
eukprot:s632_g26.t2